MAAAISFIIALISPDVIVIGGGLATDESWLINPVERRVNSMLTIQDWKGIPIKKAELWQDAVLYGAVELIHGSGMNE